MLPFRRLTAALAGALAAATFVSVQGASAQTEVSGRGASLRLGGRVHVQYAASSAEGDRAHFFLRRARIEGDITVNDFLDARIQPEFGAGGAGLRDAFVRLRFSPGFQVTMGQFKRPFDPFWMASSVDLSLIERDGRVGGVNECAGVGSVCSFSRLTGQLAYADRDLGVRIAGTRGRFSWEGAVTNGTGQNVPDENGAKSYSGRVTARAGSSFTLGGNVALHDYVDPGRGDAYASAWGVDAQVGSWRDGLLLQGAIVGGDNWRRLRTAGGGAPVDPARPGAGPWEPASFLAFQAVASYYAPLEGGRFSGIEPLLRVSLADPDQDGHDDGGAVLTPGLMLYVAGRSKIGFNWDVWLPSGGNAEHSLKVQTFLYF